MSIEMRRPRGRRPLGHDNTTKERLLEAAQRLFETRSFLEVGTREIAEEAGLAVGTINYQFGSKDGLLDALCDRITPALSKERLTGLSIALTYGGSREERLRRILRALIQPVLMWSLRSEARLFFGPFLTRVKADGPQRIRELKNEETLSLQPFRDAFQMLFPELSAEDIGWRLHFVLAIEHALTAEQERLFLLTNGKTSDEDVDATLERSLDFMMQGWLAPTRQ